MTKHISTCFIIVLCGYLSGINNGYLMVIISAFFFLIWFWAGVLSTACANDLYEHFNSLKSHKLISNPINLIKIVLFVYVLSFSVNIFYTAQNGHKVSAGLFTVMLIIGSICFFYLGAKIQAWFKENHE